MICLLSILFVFPQLIFSSTEQWYSKSKCTQKEFANHMDISCNANEFILIGWSHYGTKKNERIHSSLNQEQHERCEPSANDCIMDYTHKIAELCNGVSKCEVILTQQFIHKCSDEATYLFISYQCINNSTIVDVCSQHSMSSSTGLHLISPSFPNEYPNNVNCTCSIEPAKQSNKQISSVMIDVESLSFNLQDNDHLSSSKSLPLSGTLPFGISLITERKSLQLTFTTDETLSQSGFWIRLHGYHQCHDDEYTLGSKCLKIITKKSPWKVAYDRCASMGAQLIRLDDIVQEKKLTHFLSTMDDTAENSFWISDENEQSQTLSWWPWRSSANEGTCVLRTQDGWLKRPCNELNAFICERNINRQPIPLTVRCGNAPLPVLPITSTTIQTSTTEKTTRNSMRPTRPTVAFIQPPIVSKEISMSNNEENIFHRQEKIMKTTNSPEQMTATETKQNIIDPNIIAAVLAGIAMAIFFVNLMICYLCKRRSSKQSKCKTPIESQSSFTHEELQRSLMHHLYHEQTNTISSTSTSSSSSKHSQSKSNDTSTTTAMTNTNMNLLQLCSPSNHPRNASPSSYATHSNALCFRNPHAALSNNTDLVDYHVYETIPSDSASYSHCTKHSAFKPILQSNTHTFRPFMPRTNVHYHPPPSSKQSYESPSTINNSTVILPVYCHHPHPHMSSSATTSTMRQHVSPRVLPMPPPTSHEQIYSGSESIV